MFKASKFLLLLFCCVSTVHCEDDGYLEEAPNNDPNKAVFASMASLEQLLPTEAMIVTSLQSYIFTEEKKLEELRRYTTYLHAQNTLANDDKEKYLSNPINAFLLIKRMTMDWSRILGLLQVNNFESFLDFLTGEVQQGNIIIPQVEDITGAALALDRLQATYKISTASLANGKMRGVQYATKMAADDCYAIGLELHHQGKYAQAKQWMLEALKRWETEENPKVSKQDILELLAWCYFYLGEVEEAVDITDRIIRNNPELAEAKDMKNMFIQTAQDPENIERWAQMKESMDMKHEDEDQYTALCRGEGKLSPDLLAALKCYYYKPKANKFLALAPLKAEEAYKSPYILLFHDVMSDAEIERVKTLALPILERAAGVVGKNAPEISPSRLGKIAWLNEDQYPEELGAINRRLEDMTGLSMSINSTDSLQVGNYGLAGHYEPHHDSFRGDEYEQEEYEPNRIATVLIYMNDVEQGGATVFTKIGVTVWPKKGAAVFWYNLHADLTFDPRVMHAACPVLAGYKWVSNKWIYDKDQVFRKPCKLQPAKVEIEM